MGKILVPTKQNKQRVDMPMGKKKSQFMELLSTISPGPNLCRDSGTSLPLHFPSLEMLVTPPC